MKNPKPDNRLPVVTGLVCDIPPDVPEIRVKDFVGNVTTSNWLPQPRGDESFLELRPRYPIFGGWKYTWWLSFDRPVNDFVKSIGSNTYEVALNLYYYYLRNAQHSAEKARWIVTLPEGATFNFS